MALTRRGLMGLFGLAALPSRLSAGPERVSEPLSPFTTALWFAHHFAAPRALGAGNDRPLKLRLTAALNKSPELSWEVAQEFFDKGAFKALAGDGAPISVEKMGRLLREKCPPSRKDMHAKARLHADLLTTQYDMIEDAHRKRAEELVAWVVEHYRAGNPLGVIAVCTGNTRRSVLSATMGNIAASYYGLPDVRFYSGGTDPDAINPRTVATLKEIGLEVEPTGREAPRGKGGGANPIYSMTWGKGLATREFSKVYSDPQNPQRAFAALLVCSEADTACPKVTGAAARIPLPYLDPKSFDGTPFESAKYAERRDDIGRLMLSVMMQARRRLELDGAHK
ncbi:hypothetical protein R5W23_005083 [Gemmata sp. JC673]|uniref:Protein-tyrosine-phosphatase n=1 Tax=Gemmata algarum TaxID=2975278 RepID=A0ABU5F9K9_9BACT|nr:hypothetical protein [Gemmata algarum]MDY3563472.1 hypothetical protein [Gemmata algarum]